MGGHYSSVLGLLTILYGRWLSYVYGVRIVCHPLRQVVILCMCWPRGGGWVLILGIYL
ncbi:hypothetical protein GIB67_016143 [Kingdonia uniflora]|uniref:Uncharacterized protein n=1 Tax=Kingdonia uniflora TaxID=39325 RepID=A0A7J7N9N6_9MAGN|nr:hypothetical protein GIB67_016143 [Kingdonia uniflora]